MEINVGTLMEKMNSGLGIRITSGKSKNKFKKSTTALPPRTDQSTSSFKHSASNMVSMVDKEISCAPTSSVNKESIDSALPLADKMGDFHIIAPIKKLNTLESILKQEQLIFNGKPCAPLHNAKSLMEAPPGFHPKMNSYSHFLQFFNSGANAQGSISSNQVFLKQTSNTDTMDSWSMGPASANMYSINEEKQ